MVLESLQAHQQVQRTHSTPKIGLQQFLEGGLHWARLCEQCGGARVKCISSTMQCGKHAILKISNRICSP